MKLLLDTCVWPGMAAELKAKGHDVLWVGDWPRDPGDEEILSFALKEGRTVVTLDKDFGELAVASDHAHSGMSAIEQHGVELAHGAIVTAEPGRLRLRPAPSAAAE